MSADLLTPVLANPARQPEFTAREWETVLAQARQARLLARMARQFDDQGWLPLVPSGPRPHLESALRLADRQQHE